MKKRGRDTAIMSPRVLYDFKYAIISITATKFLLSFIIKSISSSGSLQMLNSQREMTTKFGLVFVIISLVPVVLVISTYG